MSVPLKDSALVSFGSNFSTRITASPTTFNLVAADATQYATLLGAFISAYEAVTQARDAGTRSKPLTTVKDLAKADLLPFARSLYGQVQADTAVGAADKELLGIVVRTMPTPIPTPVDAPALDIVSVIGRTVKIRLHDATNHSRRGKPAFVKGAAIFSYVGAVPPSDPALFKFEGNTTLTDVTVNFPLTVAPGAQVWLTAMWFNERAQSGPGCTPISTNVQFGGGLMAA